MDSRVKERLVGASILLVLLVLIVPELLSGPPTAPAPPAAATLRRAASTPEAVRNITVDLATSKAPAADSAGTAAASSAEPTEARSAAATPATAPSASVPAAAPIPAAAPPSHARPAATSRSAAPPRAARLETSSPGPTSAAGSAKPGAGGGAWAVQLGSFASRANADKLMRQLKGQGFSVYVVTGGSGPSLRYRVRVGPMADRGAATQAVAKLKSLGHAASFVPPAS
jgi:DedD protein